MRRAPIPGTNLTPFMAMRGRDPVLPIDLPLVSQAPVSNDTMDEHVKRLKANLAVTAKLVKSAMERTKEKNKDLHDLSQKQVVFDAVSDASSTAAGPADRLDRFGLDGR